MSTEVPDKQDVAFGSIQQGAMCMDTLGHVHQGTLGLYDCHNSGGNQEFSFTKDKLIKHSDLCLTVTEKKAGTPITLQGCQPHNVNQKWDQTDSKRVFRFQNSDLCLDSKGHKEHGLVVQTCNQRSLTQHFKFSMSNIAH
ncbi:polypeptide N-acetylgalactosaminyltransferase 2-like [Lytechinus pictus]|uniref:polypeptide N-acetylgalactosaminyltransferase 2-like n=1 Tax=Lytechinus pictus TaxID=7653 RepID=UPI0030BA1218